MTRDRRASSSCVLGSVPVVAETPFVPTDFEPPTTLERDHFLLEPLGPQHNEADHRRGRRASPTSVRLRDIPTATGRRRRDVTRPEPRRLRRHAADFDARIGFTFTVLDPVTGDVIGCVYLYPSQSPDADVTVQSWVRSSHAELDVPLADAVAAWLAAEWPWARVHTPAGEPDRIGEVGASLR